MSRFPTPTAPADRPPSKRSKWGATGQWHHLVLGAVLWMAAAGTVSAQPTSAPGLDYKFTAGRYASSDGNDALDLNLRAATGPHTGWLGSYRDQAGYQQWRTGYEYRLSSGPLRSVWSLQNASGGALVGSVGAEVGGSTFAILGFGRTNRRPYVNLNFDPNDMVTLGVGSRAWEALEWSLFQVRDDRLGTGQRVTHAVLRWQGGDRQRVTVDWSTKQGRLDDGRWGRGPGLSVTYDHADIFVRVARDRHAGFAVPDQTRLSAGWRF